MTQKQKLYRQEVESRETLRIAHSLARLHRCCDWSDTPWRRAIANAVAMHGVAVEREGAIRQALNLP